MNYLMDIPLEYFPFDLYTLFISWCDEVTFDVWRLVGKRFHKYCTWEKRLELYRIPTKLNNVFSRPWADLTCDPDIGLYGYSLLNKQPHGIFRGRENAYYSESNTGGYHYREPVLYEQKWNKGKVISLWITHTISNAVEYHIYQHDLIEYQLKEEGPSNAEKSSPESLEESQIFPKEKMVPECQNTRILYIPKNCIIFIFNKKLQRITKSRLPPSSAICINFSPSGHSLWCNNFDRRDSYSSLHIVKNPVTKIITFIESSHRDQNDRNDHTEDYNSSSGYIRQSKSESGFYPNAIREYKTFHRDGSLRYASHLLDSDILAPSSHKNFYNGYHKFYHHQSKRCDPPAIHILQRYEDKALKETWKFSRKGDIIEYVSYDTFLAPYGASAGPVIIWRRHGEHIFYKRGIIYHYQEGQLVWSEKFDAQDELSEDKNDIRLRISEIQHSPLEE
jgi:hypothetical protein